MEDNNWDIETWRIEYHRTREELERIMEFHEYMDKVRKIDILNLHDDFEKWELEEEKNQLKNMP